MSLAAAWVSDMDDESFGSKPAKLALVLQNLVRRKGLAEQSAEQELDRVWKTVAGKRAADSSYVRKLRGGVLEIGVTNRAILEELNSYLRQDLLLAMQQQYPDPPIVSLKFVKVR